VIVVENGWSDALDLLRELAPPQEKPCGSDLRSISRVRDGRVVATVVLAQRRILPYGATVEIAIAARPLMVTRGFLRAAMDEACAGVTRIEAHTHVDNDPVIRLLNWLGFQREGVLQRAWNGREPALLWSITPEQWGRRRPATDRSRIDPRP